MAFECRHVLAARGVRAPIIEPAAQSAPQIGGVYGEMPDMRQSWGDFPGTGTFAAPAAAAGKDSLRTFDHSIAPRGEEGRIGPGHDGKRLGKEIGRIGGRHQDRIGPAQEITHSRMIFRPGHPRNFICHVRTCSKPRRRLRVGAVEIARIAEGFGIDARCRPGDEIGHEPAGARPEAEAMA